MKKKKLLIFYGFYIFCKNFEKLFINNYSREPANRTQTKNTVLRWDQIIGFWVFDGNTIVWWWH